MATWKKVIVSGSSPALASVTLDTELAIGSGGTGGTTQGTAQAALGVGPIIGNTSLTTVGTIGTGTWNADVIASAKLDADTAHLTEAQTFTGAKTFQSTLNTAAITATGNVSGSSTSTGSFGHLLGDASQLDNLPSGYTVANFGNDRILTSVNSSNANAESTLTFSSTTGILENTAGVGSKISGSLQSTGSFGHVVGTTYAGDGSGLTNVETDIDTLTELTVTPDAGDMLLVSNNGDSEKITWARVRDGVFASISDHATVAAGGVLTIGDDKVDSQHYVSGSVDLEHIAVNAVNSGQIAAGAVDLAHMSADSVGESQIVSDAVTYAKMQEATANSLLGRDANSQGDVSAITVANTQIVIGDGTGFTVAALSGDVTMANDGEVTIGATKVTDAMLNDDVATGLAGAGINVPSAGVLGIDVGNGIEIVGGEVAVDLVSGNDTLTNSGLGLKVATQGISPTELNTSVGGVGIGGGDGDALFVDLADTAFKQLTATFGGMVINGDLTVSGTTTTLDTQNLLVEDPMIFAATGSAGGPTKNVDAGLIVQSGSADLSGSAIFHEKLGQRWAVAKGVPASSSVVTPEQYVTTVAIAQATAPGATSGSYGAGEMSITNTGDIWIRTA
jgi:hypothetical protein